MTKDNIDLEIMACEKYRTFPRRVMDKILGRGSPALYARENTVNLVLDNITFGIVLSVGMLVMVPISIMELIVLWSEGRIDRKSNEVYWTKMRQKVRSK